MTTETLPGAAVWFGVGENYFRTKIVGKSPDITGLNFSTIDRLDQMFIYVRRHPDELEKRANQLDSVISSFNWHHHHGDFGKNHVNAKKLSRILKLKGKQLPLVKNTTPSLEDYKIAGRLHSGISRGTYSFVDAIPESNQLMHHLITATLIDGYGLAMAGDNEKIANLISNAICEETKPGPLQKTIWELGWFNPKYGFAKTFTKKINNIYQ